MNIRKVLSGKKDRELARIYNETEDVERIAIKEERKLFGLTPETAIELSDSREVATVAVAVGKQRLLGGGHNWLVGYSKMRPNPKRANREWAESLRERRF